MPLYLGIDLGTSGCRVVAVDDREKRVAEERIDLPPPQRAGRASQQDPELWWPAVCTVLNGVLHRLPPRHVAAVAVDGTSGTTLLVDAGGHPLTPALMYDDGRALEEARRVAAAAPPDVMAGAPTSALARLLWLAGYVAPRREFLALQQADWVAGKLAGRFGSTDENNALKLGYDAVSRSWPAWLERLPLRADWFPKVLEVGSPVGRVGAVAAAATGLPDSAWVIAGTTDSTASAIAAGALRPGDAVTVLGSTLVVKVVAATPVNDPASGVYSHRFGAFWLVGGASNTGGAVLAEFFTRDDLLSLEAALEPDVPTGLDYYPLARPGERFPVNDPSLPPRTSPRPSSRALFLQGLLEGIAAVEAAGYRRLEELGCPFPRQVATVGGGARNQAWRRIRERILGVEVAAAHEQEAAYGTAVIARRGFARLSS